MPRSSRSDAEIRRLVNKVQREVQQDRPTGPEDIRAFVAESVARFRNLAPLRHHDGGSWVQVSAPFPENVVGGLYVRPDGGAFLTLERSGIPRALTLSEAIETFGERKLRKMFAVAARSPLTRPPRGAEDLLLAWRNGKPRPKLAKPAKTRRGPDKSHKNNRPRR